MRADGTRVPGRARRHPARAIARRAGLLRLPARPDRALRGRDGAAPAGRRAGGAAARGDGGRGRARVRRGCSRWSARRSGGCWRRGRRTCSASTPTGEAGTIVGGWALRPSTCCRSARACRSTATRRRRACGAPGAPARMDSYDQAEGELAATLRGYGVQAVVAAPVFLGGSLWGAVIVSTMDPQPFPDGRRAADLLLRRARRAGAGQRPGARGAGRLARPHRRRGRRRAPAAGAQPARRRAAAARVAGADAAARRPAAPGRRATSSLAGEELTHALQELRELARGIHPAVLTERGLEPAVRAVADRAPVPVELDGRLRRSGCPGRSRPPPTTSSPRR